MIGFLWFVIGMCFIFACATDLRHSYVYNVTWWIAGGAAIALWFAGRLMPDKEQLIGILIFIALQFLLFDTMYGRADVYAFCVCAVSGATLGFQLFHFLLQMLLAIVLLAIRQAFRHNIGRNGNLKIPVPFMPYITLAFCVLLWYHYIC